MAPSLPLPLEKRPGDESHHKDRGGRLRSTRARRRRAPVDATGRRSGTQALQAESAPPTYHTSKRTPNKQPPKNNTRRERLAQGLTKDPVQHGLVGPSTSYK